MTDTDLTLVKKMKKTWRCPYCGSVNTFQEDAEDVLWNEGEFIDCCDNCLNWHMWRIDV